MDTLEKTLAPFELEARIRSRQAASHGLSVELAQYDDGARLVWKGTDAQFSACGIWKPNFDFGAIKRQRYTYPWGLRGNLIRTATGELSFILGWCHLPSNRLSCMAVARRDEGFQRFKQQALALATETRTDKSGRQ